MWRRLKVIVRTWSVDRPEPDCRTPRRSGLIVVVDVCNGATASTLLFHRSRCDGLDTQSPRHQSRRLHPECRPLPTCKPCLRRHPRPQHRQTIGDVQRRAMRLCCQGYTGQVVRLASDAWVCRMSKVPCNGIVSRNSDALPLDPPVHTNTYVLG